MELQKRREQWERGLTVLSVIDRLPNNILVILIDENSKYHCHRYFELGNNELGDNWECSVDGREIPLESVWAWLGNPRTMFGI